jgi:hypothetical protein
LDLGKEFLVLWNQDAISSHLSVKIMHIFFVVMLDAGIEEVIKQYEISYS